MLRLATLNLQHGRANAGDRAGGVPAAAELARALADVEADVLAVQEVDVGQARSGGRDQAELIAGATGLRWYRFASAVGGDVRDPRRRPASSTERPGYGLAIFSRFPVLVWFAHPLPGGGPIDEPRLVLAAVIQTPEGRLVAGATHLARRAPVARRQLRLVRDRIDGLARRVGAPAVVLGDLNLPPARAALGGRLLAHGLTHPAWAPTRQIDHVLGLGAVEAAGPATATRLQVSDHRLLTVAVRLT